MISRKIILIGYSVLLISALVVSYLLPHDQLTAIVDDQQEISQAQLDQHLVNIALTGADLDRIEGLINVEQKRFETTDNKLEISQLHGDLNMKIIVEHKEINDEMVELVQYATRTIIHGMDITKMLPPPVVKLQDMNLALQMPEGWDVKFTGYTKEFTVNQFVNGENSGFHSDIRFIVGSRILYLLVPKDMDVIHISNGQTIEMHSTSH